MKYGFTGNHINLKYGNFSLLCLVFPAVENIPRAQWF